MAVHVDKTCTAVLIRACILVIYSQAASFEYRNERGKHFVLIGTSSAVV